jgi:hypothetical protein
MRMKITPQPKIQRSRYGLKDKGALISPDQQFPIDPWSAGAVFLAT